MSDIKQVMAVKLQKPPGHSLLDEDRTTTSNPARHPTNQGRRRAEALKFLPCKMCCLSRGTRRSRVCTGGNQKPASMFQPSYYDPGSLFTCPKKSRRAGSRQRTLFPLSESVGLHRWQSVDEPTPLGLEVVIELRSAINHPPTC